MQERHRLPHSAIPPNISNSRLEEGRDLVYSSLTRITRTSSVVNVFTLFPLSSSGHHDNEATILWACAKTCSNHFTLFWFSDCSQNWALQPCALHLAYELLTKFTLHILLLIQKDRKSLYFFSQRPGVGAVEHDHSCCCCLHPTFDR